MVYILRKHQDTRKYLPYQDTRNTKTQESLELQTRASVYSASRASAPTRSNITTYYTSMQKEKADSSVLPSISARYGEHSSRRRATNRPRCHYFSCGHVAFLKHLLSTDKQRQLRAPRFKVSHSIHIVCAHSQTSRGIKTCGGGSPPPLPSGQLAPLECIVTLSYVQSPFRRVLAIVRAVFSSAVVGIFRHSNQSLCKKHDQ